MYGARQLPSLDNLRGVEFSRSSFNNVTMPLLREDASFHAFQMFDAGVRQFGEWGNTEPGRHILIAVARYLVAHSPTERSWQQTADIAARLSRGDQLHADEPPARP